VRNRDIAAARAFHDATKHSLESVRRDVHSLDWDNQPRPFKVYPDLEPIVLPHEFETSPVPVLEALADPGDTETGTGPRDAALDLATLAHLLYFTAGITKRRTYPGGEAYFRAAACTGNLHHIDLYVICADLPGLEAGVYQFGPHDGSLHRLRAGDHRAVVVEATAGEPQVADAPVVLAFATTFWRNAWKYRTRAYRHAFWDSGTLLSNLLAIAAARRLAARIVLGFVDETLERLLDLDGAREATLGLVALGRDAPPAAAHAPDVTRLGLATLPLSRSEVDYPGIREAHVAGNLESADDVRDWRQPLSSAEGGAQTPVPLPDSLEGPREAVEQVILRRGSARSFTYEPMSFAALATILRSVTGGIPADFVAPRAQRTEIYLVVHAVDGLPAGTYAYDRAQEAVVPLAAGDFRREAGFLGLGQEIPRDAAVNLYWLTDLDPILEALGNRAYRAAQLEAAIGGGKTYLAAYALRLGASGLTFFDDDVTRFFSPHAAGKSVMFLMAVGPTRRRTRNPGAPA